jgi:L-ribulokinase
MDSREASYPVGVDFGTLSGRAVVVRVSDGAELGSAVSEYRHGVMDGTLVTSGTRLFRSERYENVYGQPGARALGG